MSGPVFTMKEGDREPSIELELVGLDISLVGRSAKFSMKRLSDGVVVVDRAPMTINSMAAPLLVQYDWQSGDTDTPGLYECEVIILNGSIEMTWPSDEDGNVIVKISPKI